MAENQWCLHLKVTRSTANKQITGQAGKATLDVSNTHVTGTTQITEAMLHSTAHYLKDTATHNVYTVRVWKHRRRIYITYLQLYGTASKERVCTRLPVWWKFNGSDEYAGTSVIWHLAKAFLCIFITPRGIVVVDCTVSTYTGKTLKTKDSLKLTPIAGKRRWCILFTPRWLILHIKHHCLDRITLHYTVSLHPAKV